MTDDQEFQPDVCENEEQENRSVKNGNDLSELSLSSASEIDPEEKEIEEEIQNDDLSPQVHDQVNEILHINKNTEEEEDELTRFINRAKHQGFNCLDLSKKNIAQFPTPLLEFPSLQYLYLEGNGITKLPDHLFLKLPNLKWIDLRNNKITRIPGIGLDKNASLRYLLLSGNLIRTLPVELGKVKGLSALNLDGNPLEHPPLDIVKQEGDAYVARAHEEQRLRHMKHRNMKITEELEKVKSKELLHDWKEDYRSTQQQLRRKRLVKGKDYQEAVGQAPFGIDPHYISVMDKDQQEFVEKAIRYESRRNRSPESAMREEEERRIRDRQIQERIREITGKIIKRRGEVRGNAFDEKRQAEVELRELRKLETEIKQRRTQVDSRFKAYTGDVKARKKL
ncbi:unnamed protein product [Rotaria magnacalcarata]|uniref:Leucine-rich repeat-containing protein 27 n=1 Tax=Rotaria magnacalcarata TaxID=392030 RepID=A0A8S2PNN2_9BILA|nr:unnamed protein product [Rotaria magnacalcarata]